MKSHDTINAISTATMAICTVAITFYACQSTKLSEKMALAAEEPVLELNVIKNSDKSHLEYELYNGSSFDLQNIKITDRLYSTDLKGSAASAHPIGGQTLVPQFQIERIKASERRPLSTARTLPSKDLIAEISSGKRVAMLELSISFQHGITRKPHARSDRYIIMPSNTGWQLVKATDEAMWVLEHFKKPR